MRKLLQWLAQRLSKYAVQSPHLNQPDHLPPVGCELLIEVDGTLVRAHRTGFISDRNRDMHYKLEDGEILVGRFRWTYP